MQKKSVTKNVRFTPDEMKYIEKKSNELNMTTSKFIRTISLKGEILKLENPEYRNIILEMNRIGTNINQIARRLNETGSLYYDDVKNIKEVHEELCLMLNQYLSTLRLKKL